jgi:tetratricopeptide (TPR) repeat protein
MMPQAQARRLALQHADRAIRLAPSNPDVRFSYGYALMYARWDWPGAEVAFREVLIRHPDHVLARSFLGLLLTVQGRDREAIEIGEDLVASDPVSAWCWWMRALYAFYRRDFGSVAEWAQEALDLAPHDPLNFWLASAGYAMTGDHARALDLADRLDEAAGEFDMFFGFATITRVLCGQRDQALVRLRELQRRAEHRPVSQVVMAFVHSALGDTEPALDALEAAFEERNMVGWFIAREFTLDPLRAEPRFQRLLEAMQLPVDGPAHRDGIPVQALPRDPS